MTTLLTVIGSRAYKNSSDAVLSVQASVNPIIDNKLNREGIFALRSASNDGYDSMTLQVDEVQIPIVRNAKNWEYTFDGKAHKVDLCKTQVDKAKKAGLPLNDDTRDHRVDLLECITHIVREHFPQFSTKAARGAGRQTNAMLKAELREQQAAFVDVLRSMNPEITDDEIDEHLAEIAAKARAEAERKAEEARAAARNKDGKVDASTVPSKSA